MCVIFRSRPFARVTASGRRRFHFGRVVVATVIVGHVHTKAVYNFFSDGWDVVPVAERKTPVQTEESGKVAPSLSLSPLPYRNGFERTRAESFAAADDLSVAGAVHEFVYVSRCATSLDLSVEWNATESEGRLPIVL